MLGKSEDCYTSLLVPIILGKLPTKTKQNLTQTNGNKKWTITELQAVLLNELYIFEIGLQSESCTDPPLLTASFHTKVNRTTSIRGKL